MFRTPLSLYRTFAIAEVFTWALLITGLILRATADLPIAVTIGGGIHGFVFLCYGATAILVAKNNRWSAGPTVGALVSAIIPFATVPVEVWLHRRGLLAGQWRLEATDDARDGTWHDRLMRWFLKHPWMLGLLLVVAIVVLFVVLLILGPPGGRD